MAAEGLSFRRLDIVLFFGLLNCTPLVRQYDILSNKWGIFLCMEKIIEYGIMKMPAIVGNGVAEAEKLLKG